MWLLVDPSLVKRGLSVSEQCTLLGVARSTYYYNVAHIDEINLRKEQENNKKRQMVDKVLDEYATHPTYGYIKMSNHMLRKEEEWATERVIRRLYKELGLKGVSAVFKTTRPSKHPYGRFPYLLEDRPAKFVNEIWATDITYISTSGGMLYYTAVIDLYSRKILSWKLSDKMDVVFCLDVLFEAVNKYGIPAIFNTDQGSQYTSKEFIHALESYGIRISMDGRGRWRDNVIVERTWRTLKYEWVFLHEYKTIEELECGLLQFQEFYNKERIHEGLCYRTPNEVYEQGCFPIVEINKKDGEEVA